jgi:hypothetical protein
MSKAKSGGGITMNKNVKGPVKMGKPAQSVRPSEAAMIGTQRITTTGPMQTQGEGRPISVPLGNAKALDVGKGGPGAGRTVHGCGSQGRHGSKE